MDVRFVIDEQHVQHVAGAHRQKKNRRTHTTPQATAGEQLALPGSMHKHTCAHEKQ